jgi:hypothetical protein
MIEETIMVEDTKPLFKGKEETRTSATVFTEDLQTFKAIAKIKFERDPMNNAFKEGMSLFIMENKYLLKEKFDEIPDKKKK